MITISRSLARQLRAVFRRAGLKPRGTLSPPVSFVAGAEGLRIRAMSPDVAVEYHLPGEYPVDELTVALELLDDCQGKRDEPVTLESHPKKRTFASWRDGDVPQTIGYAAEPVKRPFPEIPATLTAVDPSFWPALRDAAECTDPSPTRFSLNNILLRGDGGRMCATDGRQIFQHGGFQFPWTGDIMVLALGVLGCAELAGEGSVEIAKTEKELVLRLGRWTLVLALDTVGRFPTMEPTIEQAEAGSSQLYLTPADAQFLIGALPKLPRDEMTDGAITVDLDGQAFIRAQTSKGTPVAELVLSHSTVTGDPMRVQLDRKYLLRALKLGLTEFRFSQASRPVFAADDRRKYIWATLEADGALGPAADAVRIESPLAGSEDAPSPSNPGGNDPRCPRRQRRLQRAIPTVRCQPAPSRPVMASQRAVFRPRPTTHPLTTSRRRRTKRLAARASARPVARPMPRRSSRLSPCAMHSATRSQRPTS